MTMAQHALDVERRALTLFEQLSEHAGDDLFRQRLIAHEPAPVRARVCALEASVARAAGALPTLIPGSADCDGAVPPPERVGRFRLIRRLGRGGMGDVWLGERDDGLFAQHVAVKLIQRHALARAAAAFDDERRFLARLEHPGISRLIDGGVTEDGLPWLATEYVDGRPIDVAAAALPLRERVRLVIDSCEAVQFAHGRLIAHGDVKPANILVTADGRVKLLDFGIARLIDGDAPTSAAPFTPGFASPERQAGAPPSVSDDVFALGRTLAALTGSEGDAELAAIAAKASAAVSWQRYPSVTALSAELERWRGGFAVTAFGDRPGYHARKFARRHWRAIVATAIALVLLTAAGLVAVRNLVAAQRERVQAEQRFNEVRRLSRYVLFDAYGDLARKPGTVEQRVRLAATATAYLERLGTTPLATPALQLETARSWRRLAEIQGLASSSNLGDPAAAGRSLAVARRLIEAVLAERPDDVGALVELGAVAADQWSLRDGDEGKALLAEAMTLLDRALRLAPGNRAAVLQRLRVDRDRGVELVFTDDRPAQALPPLERTLARLEGVAWPEPLAAEARALAISVLNRLGDATYYAGDVAGSLAPYRRSAALVAADITRDGATPLRLALQADNAFDISGVLGELPGRLPEALAAARTMRLNLERVLALGPDASLQKKLLVLYGQEADVLRGLGRPREALAISRASIALRRARLARAPGDHARTRDLAIGLTPHATVAAAAMQRAEACAAASEAVAIWRALERSGRLDALDARRGLPQSETAKKDHCPR